MALDLGPVLSAINLALSIATMVTLGWLTNVLRVQGKDLVLARVFLRWKSAVLSTTLLEVGLIILFISNIFGWQGASVGSVSPAAEAAESVALGFILIGWLYFALFLRLPRPATVIVRMDPSGGVR